MARIEEIAAGVIDGVNDVFETVTAPYQSATLDVAWNGFWDIEIVELGGKRFRVIPPTGGGPPEEGDTLAVSYLST